jgi:hypothetical protein
MRSRPIPLIIGLLAVMAVAGCTTPTQGAPGPATTVSSETETTSATESTEPNEELPTDGAPPVTNPLDASAFQGDPCRMLTAAQSQELNVGSSGQPYDEALGNGCIWQNSETRGRTKIAFLDKDPHGLSSLYRANKAGKWAYFEELQPIEGYPAIIRDIVDHRPQGSCTVIVGVSDEIAFGTILELSQANVGKKDPCEVSAQVAGMALQTMKQGG